MVEDKKKGPNGSKYNMNEPNFLLLGDLQREGIYYLNVKRDYVKAFERWSSMALIIGSMFEEDELKELDDIRKKLFEKRKIEVPADLDPTQRFGQLTGAENYKLHVKKICQKFYLNKYVKKLNQLMRKYKISMTDLDRKIRLG